MRETASNTHTHKHIGIVLAQFEVAPPIRLSLRFFRQSPRIIQPMAMIVDGTGNLQSEMTCCVLCASAINGERQELDHVRGGKHRANVRKLESAIRSWQMDDVQRNRLCVPGLKLHTPGDGGLSGFDCTVCRKSFKHLAAAIDHLHDNGAVGRNGAVAFSFRCAGIAKTIAMEWRRSRDQHNAAVVDLGDVSSSEQCIWPGCEEQAFHASSCDCWTDSRYRAMCREHFMCDRCGQLQLQPECMPDAICLYGECKFGHICPRCSLELEVAPDGPQHSVIYQ